MSSPAWLVEARKHLGVKEIPGPKHEPRILAWWKAILRGGIKDDETPWCAAFVGGCLEAVGLVSTRFEGASSYLQWGQRLRLPTVGAIVVISRDGGWHVGFEVGQDDRGRVLVLGGNQSNAVTIAAFEFSRVVARRWPTAVPLPGFEAMPNLAGVNASLSEA